MICAGSVSIFNHPFPADFRVIDTWQLYLSNQGIGDIAYLALSYVWGYPSTGVKLSNFNIMEMRKPGALRQDRLWLPRTIRDAVDLTSCLSFRYLWVNILMVLRVFSHSVFSAGPSSSIIALWRWLRKLRDEFRYSR